MKGGEMERKICAQAIVSMSGLLVLVCLPDFSLAATHRGLATRHPGDKGIASDKAVIFTEDFEESTLNDIATHWNEAVNLAGMSLESDVPAVSHGTQSLQMTSVIGQNTGGHLYKRLAQQGGYDTLYARFYVKFALSCHPVHHFVHMGGYNPPTNWPQGGAGERPDGDERFSSGIEPMGANWHWDLYTYWMHMRTNPGGRYWGNDFNPNPEIPAALNEWICVEIMMQCNDPVTSYNGEQAFWINGELVTHLGEGFPNGYWIWDSFHPDQDSAGFEGFQWRSVKDLAVNWFWLLFYVTDGSGGQSDSVLFDDVVLATEYIGPIEPGIEEGDKAESEKLKAEGLSAYPNPFTARSGVTFYLSGFDSRFAPPAAGLLHIYDLTGRLVRSFDLTNHQSPFSSEGGSPPEADEPLAHASGGNQVTWHGKDNTGKRLPKGIYLYRLNTTNYSATKKLLML
jgi:hypothetical protein